MSKKLLQAVLLLCLATHVIGVAIGAQSAGSNVSRRHGPSGSMPSIGMGSNGSQSGASGGLNGASDGNSGDSGSSEDSGNSGGTGGSITAMTSSIGKQIGTVVGPEIGSWIGNAIGAPIGTYIGGAVGEVMTDIIPGLSRRDVGNVMTLNQPDGQGRVHLAVTPQDSNQPINGTDMGSLNILITNPDGNTINNGEMKLWIVKAAQ